MIDCNFKIGPSDNYGCSIARCHACAEEECLLQQNKRLMKEILKELQKGETNAPDNP